MDCFIAIETIRWFFGTLAFVAALVFAYKLDEGWRKFGSGR